MNRIQIISLVVSISILAGIINLIRQRKMKESYSILWLVFGFVFIVLSFWQKGLDYVATAVGISYPPSALFLLLIFAIVLILIQYAVSLTKLSDNNKKLSQEIGLLRMEMEEKKTGKAVE
jgi:hypothetical protein